MFLTNFKDEFPWPLTHLPPLLRTGIIPYFLSHIPNAVFPPALCMTFRLESHRFASWHIRLDGGLPTLGSGHGFNTYRYERTLHFSVKRLNFLVSISGNIHVTQMWRCTQEFRLWKSEQSSSISLEEFIIGWPAKRVPLFSPLTGKSHLSSIWLLLIHSVHSFAFISNKVSW